MDVMVREPELGDERELEVRTRATPVPVLRSMLVLLGAASLGSAILHAGFAPGHFEETWSHGLFFAVTAWFGLALAVALVAIPSRKVFALGLLNLGIIGVWAMSRTVGAPFGPNAWVKEEVGTPDLLATGLEAVVVLGCAWLLIRSRAGRGIRVLRGSRGMVAMGLLGCVAVAAASTAALTPRFASEHHHGTVATGGVASDGHDHSSGTAASGTVLTGNTPCEKSGPPASDGQVLDASGHSHRGPVEQLPIDQPTFAQLAVQQKAARQVAEEFPTVADAERAGYHMSTVFVPCIGAHYTNLDLVFSFDPAKPSELLFDGTHPDSKIIGLSYLVFHTSGAPDGFAGPNDHWHQHNSNGGLCLKNNVVVGAEQMSPAECTAVGGTKTPLPDVWMLHDWIVPGWECSWGVFAPECPELGGKIGGDAWTQ